METNLLPQAPEFMKMYFEPLFKVIYPVFIIVMAPFIAKFIMSKTLHLAYFITGSTKIEADKSTKTTMKLIDASESVKDIYKK